MSKKDGQSVEDAALIGLILIAIVTVGIYKLVEWLVS